MGRRVATAIVTAFSVYLALGVSFAQAAEVKVVSERYRSPFGVETIQRLVVTGGGERNDVVLRNGDDGIVVSDRAGIILGSGCRGSAGATLTAVCAVQGEDPGDLEPPPMVRAALGAGDDRMRFADELPENELGGEIDGGKGDDRLAGGLTDNILRGGPGRDVLIARGDSTLFDEGARGATGADTFLFGSGDATLSYAGRSRPVRVDMRNPARAGQRGERDRLLGTKVEFFRVIGGRGDDHLIGRTRADRLLGGGGADVIAGRGGDDTLMADGPGGDDPAPGRGRDRDHLSGGSGSDGLYGNRGRNRVDGGSGADTIRAGGGADRIVARDRSPDLVDCGRGGDRAVLDGRDDIGPTRSVRCEGPVRDRPAAATVEAGVQIDSGEQYLVDQTGGFINLRCPADAPSRCRGYVDVIRRHRRVARGRFSIGHRGGAATLRLTRLGRRLLRGDAARDLAVKARVVSRDRRGVRRSITVDGYRMLYADPNESEGPGND